MAAARRGSAATAGGKWGTGRGRFLQNRLTGLEAAADVLAFCDWFFRSRAMKGSPRFKWVSISCSRTINAICLDGLSLFKGASPSRRPDGFFSDSSKSLGEMRLVRRDECKCGKPMLDFRL